MRQTISSPRVGSGRRFLSAQWRWLAMLNYEVDPEVVRPLAPRGTELDCWQGKTYVSMVGFLFHDTRLLGVRIPWHVNFEEVNLRFYVRREAEGEIRRGVVFVKEIVSRRAVAAVARWVYNENYVALPMRHRLEGAAAALCGGDAREWNAAPQAESEPREIGAIYQWRFQGRWQTLRACGEGEPQPLLPGSHEEFIAEHYWGYCRQRDGGTIEYRVAHPPWKVWPAREAVLDCDAAALYGDRFAKALGAEPASAFLADGSAVTVDRPARIA